jgi:hypothetical protein
MINQDQLKLVVKTWNSIYPAYLDSTLSIKEGNHLSPF